MKEIVTLGRIVCVFSILVLLTTSGMSVAISYYEKQSHWNTEKQWVSTDQGDAWPMYRYDPGNTACSPSDAPEMWEEVWKYKTYEYIRASSPAVADGKLFIGTIGLGKSVDLSEHVLSENMLDNGRLVCLDVESGGLLWDYPNSYIITSPAYSSGRVYIVFLDVETAQGQIACIDSETGGKIWNDTIEYFVSSPIVVDDKVYVSFSNVDTPFGTIHCYNATDGVLLWSYTLGAWDYIICSPAHIEDKIYVVSMSVGGDDTVYCLNASTGSYIWDTPMSDIIRSISLTVTEDMIFVAGHDTSDENLRMYGLDRHTGSIVWDYDGGECYVQHPEWMPKLAVSNNHVFIVCEHILSQKCTVYCVNGYTGLELWKKPIYDSTASSPAIADGKLYFTTVSGALHCLNISDGNYIWSAPFYGGISSPVIAYEQIFVAGIDGIIYAYGEPTSPDKPVITGPEEGTVEEPYEYTFISTDPQEENLYYYIEWGDGDIEEWIGPFDSGEPVLLEHVWTEEGTFLIKAKVKDENGAESDWTTLEVTMPRNKPLMKLIAQRVLLLTRLIKLI